MNLKGCAQKWSGPVLGRTISAFTWWSWYVVWKNLGQYVRAVVRYDPNVRKRADYDDNGNLWTGKQIRWTAETQISLLSAASELTLVPPQSAIHYGYQSLVFRGVEPSDNILESCAKSKNAPILTISPPDTQHVRPQPQQKATCMHARRKP